MRELFLLAVAWSGGRTQHSQLETKGWDRDSNVGLSSVVSLPTSITCGSTEAAGLSSSVTWGVGISSALSSCAPILVTVLFFFHLPRRPTPRGFLALREPHISESGQERVGAAPPVGNVAAAMSGSLTSM